MNRVNQILKHDLFMAHLQENEKIEADRVFCHHDMVHFLDVARIAMVINLEEQMDIPKDIIYAAALLHDIGKHFQYTEGTPHELASGEITPDILKECDYSPAEIEEIVDAIRSHRNADVSGEHNLRGVLYRADKASRACFACKASADCNWKGDKKNLEIRY